MTPAQVQIEKLDLTPAATLLQQFMDEKTGVARGPRKYNCQIIQNCFVGSNAVDWIRNQLPNGRNSRCDAILIAQRWFAEGHFCHVGDDDSFADDHIYYTFASGHGSFDEARSGSDRKRSQLLDMKKRSRLFDSKRILRFNFLNIFLHSYIHSCPNTFSLTFFPLLLQCHRQSRLHLISLWIRSRFRPFHNYRRSSMCSGGTPYHEMRDTPSRVV